MFQFQIVPIDSDLSIPTMTTSTIILKFPTYSDAIATTKKIHFCASNKSTAICYHFEIRIISKSASYCIKIRIVSKSV